MIRLRDLRKSYRDGGEVVEVLQGLSLEVRAGEWLALVGPSGSGKSTLLHILGGLDRAFEGEALVDGRDLRRLPEPELARYRNRGVGFVFQSFNLLDALTALENVLLPLHFARDEAPPDARQRALEALARVGLAGKEGRLPSRLSGGERQRVALARALFRRPALILADEPTGSLDAAAGTEVVAILRQLNRDEGLTVVAATHDPMVYQQADRVVHLRQGRLEEAA